MGRMSANRAACGLGCRRHAWGTDRGACDRRPRTARCPKGTEGWKPRGGCSTAHFDWNITRGKNTRGGCPSPGRTSWKTGSVDESLGLTVFLFLISGSRSTPPAAGVAPRGGGAALAGRQAGRASCQSTGGRPPIGPLHARRGGAASAAGPAHAPLASSVDLSVFRLTHRLLVLKNLCLRVGGGRGRGSWGVRGMEKSEQAHGSLPRCLAPLGWGQSPGSTSRSIHYSQRDVLKLGLVLEIRARSKQAN